MIHLFVDHLGRQAAALTLLVGVVGHGRWLFVICGSGSTVAVESEIELLCAEERCSAKVWLCRKMEAVEERFGRGEL